MIGKVTKKSLALCPILSCLLASCATPGAMERESGEGFNPLLSMVQFYQGPLNHLSAVKQGECPMSPSCSNYSIQSLQKHGFFVGLCPAIGLLGVAVLN